MIVVERIDELRKRCESARRDGKTVGLVPTMGYFHEGHRSLMRAARDAHDLVVTTIFVNPLQFAPGEDLDAYPRDLAGDAEAAEAEGVDLLVTPSVAEMYPEPTRTTVHVAGLTEGLCGAERPTHFDGVTTVVAKLFSIVGPSHAYFGRKDFQQLAVVTRMAADLDLPVTVVGCPLVREPDGLAMSSRNAYLAPDDRTRAAGIFRALRRGVEAVEQGERDPHAVRTLVEGAAAERGLGFEYVEVRSATDLQPVERLAGPVVVAVAARVGTTRLIDNVTMQISGAEVSTDLGVITQGSTSSCSAR
jgi:pantoate--beta-alanine ligase